MNTDDSTNKLRIAIAGGRGTVGAHAVRVARERGHEVSVLSRSTGVDVLTDSGLAAALDGVDAVLDLTSVPAFSTEASMAFFPPVTRNLVAAQQRSGFAHLVTIGIVGAAAVDDGYYAGKAEQERILAATDGGWSVLRTTQFHEFVGQTATAARRGPLQLAPRMRFAPIAAAEVAEELVDLAESEPQGFAGSLAGPREEDLRQLMTRWLRGRGSHVPVIPIPLPGRFGKALRDGSVLPGPDARRGSLTWNAWLAQVADGPTASRA